MYNKQNHMHDYSYITSYHDKMVCRFTDHQNYYTSYVRTYRPLRSMYLLFTLTNKWPVMRSEVNVQFNLNHRLTIKETRQNYRIYIKI